VANCYFLLIAALQCFKPISNTDGYPTTLIPLLFVVIVDGIFQVLEDISRHRADAEANASPTIRYNKETNLFEPAKWLELQVGDFVLVENRATLPADIIPLSVAEKSEIALGICYIETKSLDGETNLKIRNALPITLDKV
jgi:phospholipid-transporting ATPase